MMDYLIAIAAALIAAVVMFFIFNNVSGNDVSTLEDVAPKKPKNKKSKAKKQKEDELDEEEEALLQQELARGPQGMGTDTDDIRPRTWDQIRRRQEARVESKRTQVVIKERTERQKMLDRELGFKVVEKPEPKPKQEAHQKEEKAADSNEVVERLLQVFFRNNNGGSAARQKVSAPVETKNEKANAGGKVVMKGEISNKTW